MKLTHEPPSFKVTSRGGRIIDNLQIDNRQIDNLTFSKIYSAMPLSWPYELGNWQHGVLIRYLIMGEVRL